MAGAYTTLLECIGEDPSRHGLQSTPMRAAKALAYFTKGYETDLTSIVNAAIFAEECNEMVVVRDIDIYSLCEHHLVPFMGKVHIGYVPNGKVLGSVDRRAAKRSTGGSKSAHKGADTSQNTWTHFAAAACRCDCVTCFHFCAWS